MCICGHVTVSGDPVGCSDVPDAGRGGGCACWDVMVDGASREPTERLGDEFVKSGDDLGVIIAMPAVGIAAGVVNLGSDIRAVSGGVVPLPNAAGESW